MHYHLGTCNAGAIWVGPGTNTAGDIALPLNITVAAAPNDVTFNYLGGNTTGTSYRITHTPSSKFVYVVVALSGRVCITSTAVTTCS
jgi:hypothetical protein